MRRSITRVAKGLLRRAGYEVARVRPTDPVPPDVPEEVRRLIAEVAPYTMTSPERVYALHAAVAYLERRRVPGAFVECGVWRGGSMMAVAKTLLALGRPERELMLFDTFTGMPAPTEADVSLDGHAADALLSDAPRVEGATIWCLASRDDVSANMRSTGYPAERIHLVEGRVEDTIPSQAPERIALLRLDTDWYESTAHELRHLVPRLAHGGVLIVDDYGHWQGARRAVDEYFASFDPPILLHRVDYTARMAIIERAD